MTDLSEHMSTEPFGVQTFDMQVGTAMGYELRRAIERFARVRGQGKKVDTRKVVLVTVDDGVRREVEASLVGVELGDEHGAAFLEVEDEPAAAYLEGSDDGAYSAFVAVLNRSGTWVMAPKIVYYGNKDDRADCLYALHDAAVGWLEDL
jgi:hypothetical protein